MRHRKIVLMLILLITSRYFSLDSSHDNNIKKAPKADDMQSNTMPKSYSGLYATFTSVSSPLSIIQQGESLTISSVTEWESYARVPVYAGNVNWYDFLEREQDEDSYTNFLEVSTIAIEITPETSYSLMGVSFNLSEISQYIDTTEIDVFVAPDKTNFESNYLMKSTIADSTYQVHANNPNSPLVFSFWDHPYTVQESNAIAAGEEFFIILSAEGSFHLQYSDDAQGTDDNRVYVNDSGAWIEIPEIDLQCGVYSGSLLSTNIIDADGKTTLVYDSTMLHGGMHRFTAAYFDTDELFEMSSDYIDIDIIDDSVPQYLELNAPATAEYTDTIQLSAQLTNSKDLPISNHEIRFYSSFDNQTWYYINTVSTDSNGIATTLYYIDKASENIYFRATSSDLSAFSQTLREKKSILLSVPPVQSIYGSEVNSTNLESFYLEAYVTDSKGKGLEGTLINFYLENSTNSESALTNPEGYARTDIQIVDWSVGYYENGFWCSPELSTDYYNFNRTYGTIEILPSNLFISELPEISISVNESVSLSFQVFDNEGDPVPYIEFKSILRSDETMINTSLVTDETDSEGVGTVIVNTENLIPGNYILLVSIESDNYSYVEQSTKVVLEQEEEDEVQQIATVILVFQTTFYYDSSSQFVIKLQSEFYNAIQNATLKVFIGEKSFTGVTDEFGSIYLSLNEFVVGDYRCLIEFKGSDKFLETTLEVAITIVPQPTKILHHQDNETLILQLVDSENKSISEKNLTLIFLNLSGTQLIELLVSTNTNGEIIVDLAKYLDYDIQSVKVEFAGSDDYQPTMKYIFLETIQIPKIIPPNDPLNSNYIVQKAISILSLMGILGLRHLVVKKKSKI